MKNGIEVSVVVPVHNEEQLIETFLTEVSGGCEKWGLAYEIVVVENGSRDNTWKIIKEAAKKSDKIKPYHLSGPGYGVALLLGIEKAKGKYLVVFNVDFWEEKFLALVKVDLLNYDVVLGSKLLPGSKDYRQISRRLVTWAYNKFLRIFLGYQGTDTHGVKVMKRKAIMPIVKACVTRSGLIDSELMIRAYRKNLKILELPVAVREVRPGRFSYRRIWETPVDIWNLAKAL
jgi:glycosyltransferase involved in cell wall biosynthesis